MVRMKCWPKRIEFVRAVGRPIINKETNDENCKFKWNSMKNHNTELTQCQLCSFDVVIHSHQCGCDKIWQLGRVFVWLSLDIYTFSQQLHMQERGCSYASGEWVWASARYGGKMALTSDSMIFAILLFLSHELSKYINYFNLVLCADWMWENATHERALLTEQ